MKKNLLLAMILTMACFSSPDNGWSQTAAGGYQGKDMLIVPAKGWPCGMPEGIPVPERGVPVFETTMKLVDYDLGLTPYGHRKACVLQAGALTGEKINGQVMPGGLDFELSLSNGTMEIEQVFVLKTSDGKFIYVRSAGIAADQSDVRFVPDFEAPNASGYNWLNSGKYVGRRVIDPVAKTMKLSIYEITNAPAPADAANSLQMVKPPGMRDQPWDYRKKTAGEQPGEQLITENVTLGQSQSVGTTKGGGRNIIPITGGTLSGKITGKVLAGGADYQKMGNPFTLDARYLWQADDGDVIIVRNVGPIASLVPTFEVRVDSKYAFLNQGTYLSSSPGMGAGGVQLIFHESKQ